MTAAAASQIVWIVLIYRFIYFLVIADIDFFITDTDYLYVYVLDNRYAEPIFIYCYKINK